jgi:hypothetical protein
LHSSKQLILFLHSTAGSRPARNHGTLKDGETEPAELRAQADKYIDLVEQYVLELANE